ncbi:MAG: type II toxin-antitoxin system Phd/YefM family antitoxin [Fidelibacterota bacterium]
MQLKKDIRSISYVKANASEILSQVNESKNPVYVTQNGEAKAVIMDPESYDNLNNSLKLLKIIAQGEKDIESKNYEEQSVVFNRIQGKLEK